MTHRLPSSLLEDFLDDELPQEQTETVRRHLEQSPELKRDYTVAVRLKSLMRRMPPPDPGEEYWTEVTDLVLARTAGRSTSVGRETLGKTAGPEQKRAFYRALFSAAAALMIFFATVLLGSYHQQQRAESAGQQTVLMTAALADQVDQGKRAVMTDSELASTSAGMLLLGSPGHVGRFAMLPLWLETR